MNSPNRRSRRGRHTRGIWTAAAAVLAIAAAVVLTVAMRSQQHAPQPPASAAHPTAEQSLPSATVAGPGHTRHSSKASQHVVGPILGRSVPVALDVPSIGIEHAPLTRYGLDKSGAVAIPPSRKGTPAGWFTGSPTPGQLGPSVIVGHVDSDSGPSIFFRLGQLRAGDRASVTLANGKVAVFEVDSVERFAKSNFPTLRVYGNLDHAGLRLITCGGAYDTSIHHYVDTIVVYAHLVTSHPA